MKHWHIQLRERSAGWYWECRDHRGAFVCASPLSFKTRWQAVQNFERWFEDYWACVKVRKPLAANTDVDWVCGL